ncbi:MAG: hypothetical protein ACX94C_00955 [Phycisphaerales bacterium]
MQRKIIHLLVLIISPCLSFDAFAQDVVRSFHPDEDTIGKSFGSSIVAWDEMIAVGMAKDDSHGDQSGAVFVFDRDTHELVTKLVPDDLHEDSVFGSRLAVNSRHLVVSAYGHQAGVFPTGSVYVYDIETLELVTRITPDDASRHAAFGRDLSINESVLAVGAQADDVVGSDSGSVFLYRTDDWSLIHKLVPYNANLYGRFGCSVDLNQGSLAVGSYSDENQTTIRTGSVYVYDLATLRLMHHIYPHDGAWGDEFGARVAMNDELLFVTSREDDDSSAGSGSVYVYESQGGHFVTRLSPPHPVQHMAFGSDLSIEDNLLLVGAWNDWPSGVQSGSSYLYNIDRLELLGNLAPEGLGTGDRFGGNGILHRGQALITAINSDLHGINSGIAYELTPFCSIDFDRDWDLDFFDASAFYTYFSINDPIADLDQNGSLNFFDIARFLQAWRGECFSIGAY